MVTARKCAASLDRAIGMPRAHGAPVTALHVEQSDARLPAMPALRATSLRHVRPVVPLPRRCLAPDVCVTLGVHLLVAPVEKHPIALRVARDPVGDEPVLTHAEAEAAATARLRELEAAAKAPAKKRRKK